MLAQKLKAAEVQKLEKMVSEFEYLTFKKNK